MHEQELEFANQNYFIQGALQFPFDNFLTESEIHNDFIYCKILKKPSSHMSVEKIIDTY